MWRLVVVLMLSARDRGRYEFMHFETGRWSVMMLNLIVNTIHCTENRLTSLPNVLFHSGVHFPQGRW